MAHNKRMGMRAGRLLGLGDPVMILVSDDSKGLGEIVYSMSRRGNCHDAVM